MTEPRPPGVTVVVPTLNRGRVLVDCLSDLAKQDFHPLEVLVVDQSDTVDDEVRAVVERSKGVINYQQVTFRGLPEARNYGWQQARYQAIIYVDDDVRIGEDFVSKHYESLTQPNVGVVAGGIEEPKRPEEPAEQPGRFDWWTATPQAGYVSRHRCDTDLSKGCNFSVWRHAIEEVGGFDERLNVGAALYEEAEMCLRILRAGYRVFFDGEARLVHLVEAQGGCRVEQIERYAWSLGHNTAILVQRHLHWYHRPSAVVRLVLRGLSYAAHYRAPKAFFGCLAGFFTGWKAGRAGPLCRHRRAGAP